MINLKFDLRLLKRKLDDVGSRQLPFATALTLTRVGYIIREEQGKQMVKDFDKPTPYTQKSIVVFKATKRNLAVTIFVKDEAPKGTPPVKYLAPQVYGGRRRVKRFERALQSAGLLGRNQLTVPGQGQRLNQYGNIPAGTITTILSVVKASSDETQNISDKSRKRNKRPREFFVARGRDNKISGVWERYGAGRRKVRPVLIFVDAGDVTYTKTYEFFGVVETVLASGVMRKEFKKAMREARRTAR